MLIYCFNTLIVPLVITLTFLSFPYKCRSNATHMCKYTESKYDLPFKTQICVNSYVPSLTQCASLACESKTVTFFYNEQDSQCKWNCTFSYPGSCSAMCMFPWTPYELEWRNNSAIYKIPVVSSIFHDSGSEWGPHYATDGLFQTGENQIFHSDFETNPWMMIDLQEILLISFIRVFNRGNLGHRFHDVAVEVSNNTVFEQRGFYQGPGVTLQVVEIFCEYQTIAQKVRLRMTQGTVNTLNIPEIEIYTM